MAFAAWNPLLAFNGTTKDEDWERANAIVETLHQEHPVTTVDLQAGVWRVMEFDTPTKEAAAAALSDVLDEIDADWQDVLRIAVE